MQGPNLSQAYSRFFNVVLYGVQLFPDCKLASMTQRGTPYWKTLLLLRNARRLAHRVPAPELARHVLAERLGGRAAHDHAGGGQALLHRLLLEAFVDGRVELGDD